MPEPELTPRPARESRATMTELMMPSMANTLGNVFGGVLLSLVDRVASVAAVRHARCPCVTVSVDRVEFRQPIHVGELVTAHASVNYVGHTSLDVGVRVEAENVVSGERRHTNSCYLTFVAIDRDGHPTPVPPLVLESERERSWHEHAKLRRRLREEERREGSKL
jgi:acyl-CoA hydrolase